MDRTETLHVGLPFDLVAAGRRINASGIDVFPPPHCQQLMHNVTRIQAYYDASGDMAAGGILEIGSVIARRASWLDFREEWSDALRRRDVEQFHHTDFKAREGEFTGWTDEDRKELLGELLKVFRKYVECWNTYALRVETFEEVQQSFDLSIIGSPFMLVALFAQSLSRKWRNKTHPSAPIEHYFEAGDQGQTPESRLEDWGFQVIPSFSEERGHAYPLQAADLVAGEMRTLRTGMVADDARRIGRFPLRRLYESVDGRPGWITASDLRRFCRTAPRAFPPR